MGDHIPLMCLWCNYPSMFRIKKSVQIKPYRIKDMAKLSYCLVIRWCNRLESHKSHNAPIPYPTMHTFLTSVTKWCIAGYLRDVLWDL